MIRKSNPVNHFYRLGLCILFLTIITLVIAAPVKAEGPVRFFGYVVEENGIPVQNCCVTVNSGGQEGYFFKNTQTDNRGYYELILPFYPSYEFFVEGRDCGNPYSFKYIPEKNTVTVDKPGEMQVDFKLRPGANILIHAYDNNGNFLRNKDFQEKTFGEVFALNPEGLPHYAVYHPIHDSSSILGRQLKGDVDLAIPAFVIPPQTKYDIYALWEVPEFGKIILSADNGGKGYSLDKQGEELVLNFNYEAAKSKTAALQRDLDLLQSQGYAITGSIRDGLASGISHLTAAEKILESSEDMKSAVRELNLSLKNTLLAHEQLNMGKAQADIEKYRKGNIKIRVVDGVGKPIGGCSIVFRQTGHDFVFSAVPMRPEYANTMKEAGINRTFAGFGFGTIEPEPGRFDWSSADGQINSPLREGFELTPNLGWLFFHGWGDDREINCPRYLDGMSFEDVKKTVYNHMYATAHRYKGKIDIWNALFEICPTWSNEFNWTWNQKLEIFKAAAWAIKAADPEAKILSKDAALPYMRHMGWSCYEPAALDKTANWIPFSEFIALAGEKQIPIDIIALELPSSGVDMYQTGIPNIHPALDMTYLSALLDDYARFNKSIFIMDYHVPSTQAEGSCWWHKPWDEQVQAEYAEKSYTIAFSKPLVQGIEWGTGIDDGLAAEHGSLSSGLLYADFKPKPAYFTLKKLIDSWTTTGTGKTDKEGKFNLRGFAGDYDLVLKTPGGRTREMKIHINEQFDSEMTVKISR
ncbi:MAG TPA: hypothetical protein VEG39_19800 [Clostridia bacterium]|nr:hypothetical protein [Clostridia bacterium]